MTAPKHVREAVDRHVTLNALRVKSPELGASAGKHVLGFAWSTKSNAYLGDGRMFPGERVVQQWTALGPDGGEVWVSLTEAPRSGRIIVSDDREGRRAYGGLALLEYQGQRCIHSAYIVAAHRGQGYGRVLAHAAKSLGVNCGLGPASSDGKAFAKRYGFKAVN